MIWKKGLIWRLPSPWASLFRTDKAFRVTWDYRRVVQANVRPRQKCQKSSKGRQKWDSSMAMVNNTSVSHFKVKNTLLKHTDGKGNFKRMLSFLQVEGRLFFIKLSFEEFKIHGIFITADRSAWPVLKRHQAAKFLKNFQVHFVLYSQENYAFVNILSLTFYTFWDRLERPDLRFVLNNFCHVLSRFYLRERIHEPNLCHANCF